MIYEHLRNYQSVLYVWPTQIAAREEFFRATENPPPPDLADINILVPQLSIVRTNPKSRTPTAIRFVTATGDHHHYRGFSAIVEIPAPPKHWRDRERWLEFQAIQERHRVKS